MVEFDDGTAVLACFGGQVVEGGDILECAAQVGVAFVEDGGFLAGLLVVAYQGLVQQVALVEGQGSVVVEKHFHVPAVVFNAGKHVDKGVVVDGAFGICRVALGVAH